MKHHINARMKKRLLTLALGLAPLVQAEPSPAQILQALAPSSTSPSPELQGESALKHLAAQFPSLAGIPSDVSLVLTLPQVAESLKRLEALGAPLALNEQAMQMAGMLQGLSLALDKDALKTLSQYGHIMLSGFRADTSSLTPNSPQTEQQLEELAEATVQQIKALTLPTIYLSGSAEPALAPKLEQAIAQLNDLVSQVQPEATQRREVAPKLFLTRISPIEASGMKGLEFQLEFELRGHIIKKSYSLLYKLEGQQIQLIATPQPDKLKLADSLESSLLATDFVRGLNTGQDFHFHLAEKKPLELISHIIAGFLFRFAVVAEEYKHYEELVALLPHFSQGLSGSLNLAGNPQLQLQWQNEQYSFEPSSFPCLNLLSEGDELRYWANSAFTLPDMSPLLEAKAQRDEALAQLIKKESAHAKPDSYLGKDGRFQEVRLAAKKIKNKASLQVAQAITGQYSYLQLAADAPALMIVGAQKPQSVKAAFEQMREAEAMQDKAYQEIYATTRRSEQYKLFEQSISLTKNQLIISKDAALRERVMQVKDAASFTGALFAWKSKKLSPFTGIYGRMDNEGTNYTLNIQLRRNPAN